MNRNINSGEPFNRNINYGSNNKEVNWTKVLIIVLLWLIGGVFVPFAIITFIWMMLTNIRWSDTYLGRLCDIWE